ncbi:hypothetical protein HYC85_029103 [Camellia sinensis]|uniref:Integrase catalytic domain-containing protein n=1 Tax=Camellia sinensis TaxID=4442 RepID=A0A7J7FX58_CAMSI|nr:hypothetical protein HYC85_029103 [Camellia sinensis]
MGKTTRTHIIVQSPSTVEILGRSNSLLQQHHDALEGASTVSPMWVVHVPKIHLGKGKSNEVNEFLKDESLKVNGNFLGDLISSESCKNFSNLTVLNRPPILFRILTHNLTLFKCNISSDELHLQTIDYFCCTYSYVGYSGYTVYYKYPNHHAQIPSNKPCNCEVIELPMLHPIVNPNASALYSLLAAEFSILFHVLIECPEFHLKGVECLDLPEFQFKTGEEAHQKPKNTFIISFGPEKRKGQRPKEKVVICYYPVLLCRWHSAGRESKRERKRDYIQNIRDREENRAATQKEGYDLLPPSTAVPFAFSGAREALISNNDTQFDCGVYRELCSEYGIRPYFSTPAFPQSNGQAEASNKVILDGIKKRLEKAKGRWVEELPSVLLAHHTTPRRSTGETPFALCFGNQAIIPLEIGLPTLKSKVFDMDRNDMMLALDLTLIEERRDRALASMARYQQQLAKSYNQRIQLCRYVPGELLRKKVLPAARNPTDGKLGPNWDGPYQIDLIVGTGAYRLKDMSGRSLPRPWNSSHLSKFNH